MTRKTCCTLMSLMCLGFLYATPSPAADAFSEQDRANVQAVFVKQAQAATAHDLEAFSSVFLAPPEGAPDPVVFVARAYQFWGKPALMAHFKETFKGVWTFEPDLTQLRIVPLTPDVAQLYAPTHITLGHTPADARTALYHIYEVAVRTPQGWRISSIIPVAAQ